MVKITGMEEAQRAFSELAKKAEDLGTSQEVPLSDLLPDSFIRQHTRFQTLREMVDASALESDEQIGSAQWEAFIAQSSSFDTWDAMLGAGATDFLRGKLGF